MEPLNLRLQEYRLALLIFRAGRLLALNKQTNKSDKPKLLYDLFEYCYCRYLTFDLSIDVSVRNQHSVKSTQAKERIIAYLQQNKNPNAVRYICNLIFGVKNWSYVLPLQYTNYEIE